MVNQHGEDVRVLQPGGEADLPLEPFEAEGGGEAGVEHLERDRPVVLEIVRQVDRGHAAAADLPAQLVAAGERKTKALRVAHTGASGVRGGDGHERRK
jgi:hypothetical protein